MLDADPLEGLPVPQLLVDGQGLGWRVLGRLAWRGMDLLGNAVASPR
jgi:hypothetical protein